jgi:cell division protein FtsN
MARKKTARAARRRRKSEPLPGWVWMLFGLAVGLAVAVAIYVNDRRLPASAIATTHGTQPAKPAKAGKAAPDKPEARFDFYDMLPKFEVIIPEQDLDARPDVTPAAVEQPGAYVLQAGSFSTFADADRMKAQLALLGISSHIQKVSVDDRTYHRVRIGPLEDLNELNRTRDQLRNARVEVLVIRVAD